LATAAQVIAMTSCFDRIPIAVFTAFLLISGACSNTESSGSGSGAVTDTTGGTNFGDVTTSDVVSGGDGSSTSSDAAAGGPCSTGQRKCIGVHSSAVCVGGKWALEEVCTAPRECKDGHCADPASCKAGEAGGCYGFSDKKICSSDGKGWIPVPCPSGELCIKGVCKATKCFPKTPICEGKQHFKVCKDDGSGYAEKQDCKTGAYCLGGKCISLCEKNLKVASNVGCEYWSADLDNFDDFLSPQNPKGTPHSIVISNPGIYDATIKFEALPPWKLNVANPVVKAGESVEFKMPVMNVDGNSISNKGIHVLSDQPIVAYQFNPFNAEKAYSNDGSLLIPHNALGKEYYIITRASGPDVTLPGLPKLPPQLGYFSVLATRKGLTKVTVTISGTGYVKAAPVTGKELKAGQTATFTLKQYDVLNLEAHSTLSGIKDLSGTRVVADQPVAVFGGHEELVLGYDGGPDDNCCAEHVEEQLLPLQAWGTSAVCPKTRPRGKEKDVWVVMASKAGVKVTTNPKIPGLDGHTFTAPGQWKEVHTAESFELSATGKIQVGQFIVSQQQTDDFTGDPTFIIHPPTNQLRADYFILTPKGYTHNHASVVRPKGLEIKLDATAIPNTDFKPIGSGKWELAYVKLKPGMHRFEATQSFGLSVYGYGSATAYGYPGGMTLK